MRNVLPCGLCFFFINLGIEENLKVIGSFIYSFNLSSIGALCVCISFVGFTPFLIRTIRKMFRFRLEEDTDTETWNSQLWRMELGSSID